MYTTRKRVAAVAALVVTSLTTGCVAGLPVGGSVDAAAVGEHVEQRYDALDGYDATVTRTVEVGEQTQRAAAAVTVRGDHRDVTYATGPRAGETTAGSANDTPVFAASTGLDAPATAASLGATAEALVAANNVSVDRVTTVEGQRTAVVTFAPSTAASNDVTRTVWVDLERNVPSKVVTSWTTAAGESATVTVEYDNVTLYEGNDTATGGGAVTADDATADVPVADATAIGTDSRSGEVPA